MYTYICKMYKYICISIHMGIYRDIYMVVLDIVHIHICCEMLKSSYVSQY